jgi:hypothetical protein
MCLYFDRSNTKCEFVTRELLPSNVVDNLFLGDLEFYI